MKTIAQVLSQQPQDPAAIDPAVAPYLPNLALEQQTAPTNVPVNPLVLAIAHRLGVLNLVRNRANQQQAASEDLIP